MEKTKKIVQAQKIIEIELRKQLGKKAKVILNKIDRMVEQKKSRSQIEAMIAAEISRHTRRSAQDQCAMVT